MKKIILLAMALVAAFADCKEKPTTKVVIKTSMGDIHLWLYDNKSPETVKNFLQYVDAKFYDGTIFHRVISNFTIQGGGFAPDMAQKQTNAPIKNEANNGVSNSRGTIAMARTMDVNSATSQFFINVVDNVMLDHGKRDFGYCVFGKVSEGMDVVDKIKNVPTKSEGMMADIPVEPVKILSVTRE